MRMLSSVVGPVTAAVISITLAVLGLCARRKSNYGRTLPPGPIGLPLIGNLLQVPRKTVILIGNMEVAKTLLEKHSAKNSSRPDLYYIRNHINPSNDMWGLGNEHLIGRKLTNHVMSIVRAGKTELLQEFEAVLNVQHLLQDGGKNWLHYIERVASSTVLTAAFGLHCPTGHEPELREILCTLAEIANLASPTASITNFFPFLDLLPGPMPWRSRARSYQKRLDALYVKLIDHAVRCNAAGMDT
ncbi:hypothetical protein C0993_007406, partial [Termitomyces sp. T159_Od127]